jgi:hypothetical protein
LGVRVNRHLFWKQSFIQDRPFSDLRPEQRQSLTCPALKLPASVPPKPVTHLLHAEMQLISRPNPLNDEMARQGATQPTPDFE